MGFHKREANSHRASLFVRWWPPLAVLAGSSLLLAGGDAARMFLRYERAGIAVGEVWRLISGHFVHLGTSHFLMNALGLGLVWYLVGEVLSNRQWCVALALAIAGIDAGFWVLNPDLQWYVGLSGALHALLVTGLIVSASAERKEMLAVAALVALKVAWEQLFGALPGSMESSGGPVIVDAHLYGFCTGLIVGIALRIRVRRAGYI